MIPKDLNEFQERLGQKESSASKSIEGKRRKKKNPFVPKVMPPATLFDEYRKALDTAVKISTVHNVDPIRGSTVVFCNVGEETDSVCKTAKGLGSSVRKIQEIGCLLGLMCKYVCEDCDFRYVFSSFLSLNSFTNSLSCHIKTFKYSTVSK